MMWRVASNLEVLKWHNRGSQIYIKGPCAPDAP